MSIRMTAGGKRISAEAVLRQIEELSRTEFLPIIGPKKGAYLADVVQRYRARRVLEVGTLIGYSAILIAMSLPEDGKVITIEVNPGSAARAAQNIRRAGLSDKIEMIVGNAMDVIPGLQEEFDIVFLDAAKDQYLAYLKLAEGKLKPGGVVFADNVKVFARAMQDFLEYVRESGKYRSEYIDVGFDGVEISVKLR